MSTRPYTTWTSTSSGVSCPRETNARSSRVLPTSGASATPEASTWSTRTPDQAARTRVFHAASSRAPAYPPSSDAQRTPARGRVEPEHVVAHHPAGEHLRPEGLQGVAHHLDPARRLAVGVAVVEQRRDGVLEQVVERGRLEVVAVVGVGDAVGGGDGPAVVAVVHLVPPPVEDRQVEAAVERRLHARRAARLERAQRVVQPHVAARVERLGHRDVVVGQEDDPVAHAGVVGEPDELLDQLLAAVVGRVRLAGDRRSGSDAPGRAAAGSAAPGRAASA